MRFTTQPKTNELAAVVAILGPRLGNELTATDLVKALTAYDAEVGRDPVSDRLLHPCEAARRLNVSRRLLYYLISEGKLPAVKLRSRLRIRESDVQKLVERGTDPAGPAVEVGKE